MSTQIQHRRGTAAQHESFTGAMSEFTHNTTNNRIHVHDSSKVGGHATLMESDKGAAGGLATLDENGNVPAEQLGNLSQPHDFTNVAEVQSAIIRDDVLFIRLSGYLNVGIGGALYARVGTEPSHSGKIQSSDGKWWEIAEKLPNVLMFGAVGDGVVDDTASFTRALSLGSRIAVPLTSSFYDVSSLSTASRKKLFGPGIIKVAGAQIKISSDENIGDLGAANVRVVDHSQAPPDHFNTGTQYGSVGRGALSFETTRTGGSGHYGNILVLHTVAAQTRANEFDVGITSWATAQNMSVLSSQIFGGWFGANTPSSAASQTFAGGAAIGAEINVGNRWADFGLLATATSGSRYTAGLQVVPDVVPASDVSPGPIYPGSFGIILSQSIHGHKWWVGQMLAYGTIMAGGYAYFAHGGGSAASRPAAFLKLDGYWVDGLDFTATDFSGVPFAFSAAHIQTTVGAAGAAANLPTKPSGYYKIKVAGIVKVVPYYDQ